MFVRLLSLRDLRDGAEPNKYWAWWLGLHRIVITIFLFPHFLLTMFGPYIVVLSSIFYLYAEHVLEEAQHHPLVQVFRRWREYLLRGEMQ